MNIRLTLLTASLLATAAIAQTQAGSANTVDPYAPTPAPSATTSSPAIQTGTDTAVTTPVSSDAQVNAARLAKMDKDRDGQLSLAEFTAGYLESKVASTNEAGAQSGTADSAVVFKQLDADNDTFLSAGELAAAAANETRK